MTIVALLLIIFSGITTFINMPRAEDPGFIIRWAMVTTDFPGASPERVERLVTDKLEKAIQEMPEVDFIYSTSKTGFSLINVGIKESYTEMRPIWDKLRRKVERVKNQGQLPQGVFGPRVDDEFFDVFGTIIMLTGEGYSYAELMEIADEVRNELLILEDVAKVEIHGAQEEHIFIEFNNARLAELGISASQLNNMLAGQNILLSAGKIITDKEEIILEPTGNFESVHDIKRALVNIPGQQDLIYLEDIAHVYRGTIDPAQVMVRSNGRPSLALALSLRDKGNIIRLGEKVHEKIQYLKTIYPIGIEFDYASFQADIVDAKVNDFIGNLLQAVFIVLVIMLAFLGFRTGLIVATLVPMAMIMCFALMGFFNIGLDQMSLASLIIALGMLVDNAIVMSESIMVQMAQGKKAKDAAIQSANELKIPLLTSSLTTAAAFLPIYLAESGVGEYTAPLFKVVTITLLSSWILSITMIPMLCVLFLKIKRKSREETFNTKLYNRYRTFLLFILKHKAASVIVVFVVFGIAMQGFGLLPNIFFPASDRATFTAEFNLPESSPISQMTNVVDRTEKFIHNELLADSTRQEGIVNWATFIGQGPPSFVLGFSPEQSNPAYSCMIINTTSGGAVIDSLMVNLEHFTIKNFPDVRPRISRLNLGPPPDAPVNIRIFGKDLEKTFQIADAVQEKLASTPGTKDIYTDWGQRTKKLIVKINQARAKRAGVTSMDIALSLQTALTGMVVTEYRQEDDIIPIMLRSIGPERQDLSMLETINVYSQATGANVPLKQVADLEVTWQPSKRLHRDLLNAISIKCDVDLSTTPLAVASRVEDWLKEQKPSWGIGYGYEIGGEQESSDQANQSINEKLPIAGLLIILLLVGQFNSLRRPLIILLTIPLGLIGVIIGLLVMRSYFGFMTFLGVISLAGVVINNAIVLLDRIKIERNQGLNQQDAVIEASQSRLRPIFLTTATTIGGLVPLYLGGGPMWEPMAVAIMFGLAFATVLTLGFVPVLYSIFFNVKFNGFEYKIPKL